MFTINFVGEQENGESPCGVVLEESLRSLLQQHCFDMSVRVMRSIIAQAAGPPDASSIKGGRRNWYAKQSNMPAWWGETGLPFIPVSRKKGALCLLVDTCEYTTKKRKINIFAYKERGYEYVFVGNVMIKQDDLWRLIEALQEAAGIMPQKPKFVPSVAFQSRFHYDS